MAFESITDEYIDRLLQAPKRVVSAESPKPRQKGAHLERKWDVIAEDGERFEVYSRSSTLRPEDYSVGIRWLGRGGADSLMLLRCNGPGHPHRNAIDRATITFVCHIHKATVAYIQHNRSEEGHAVPTQEYSDVDGALAVLGRLASISGLPETQKTIEF